MLSNFALLWNTEGSAAIVPPRRDDVFLSVLPLAHAFERTVLARIVPLLAALPRYAQVRAVHLTLEPWTIEAGLLTPTLKVKRDVVQRNFAAEIVALYPKPPLDRLSGSG